MHAHAHLLVGMQVGEMTGEVLVLPDDHRRGEGRGEAVAHAWARRDVEGGQAARHAVAARRLARLLRVRRLAEDAEELGGRVCYTRWRYTMGVTHV